MFGFQILRFELQIFISCGFGLRFFNYNVLFWVCQIDLLMFSYSFLGFELQIFISCGFGFGFLSQMVFLSLSNWTFDVWCRNFGFELQIFSSCGLGFALFNSNVSFWVCQIELLMFRFRIFSFELQMCFFSGYGMVKFVNSNVSFSES